MGFSPEAGKDMFEGNLYDDLETWTEEQYFTWVFGMSKKYHYRDDLLWLYAACSQIMNRYAPMLILR